MMREVADRGIAGERAPGGAPMVRTVLLIVGNSLTYRGVFALPTDLATASGQVTNSVFGFTSMLVNLLRDHSPQAVAVAFDRPEPTFRHERTATYQGTRESAPNIMRQPIDRTSAL